MPLPGWTSASIVACRESGSLMLPSSMRAGWSSKFAPDGARIQTYRWRFQPAVASPSAVLDGDRLDRREAAQAFEGFLAAVARMLHAAERQFDAAAGAVVVDE